MTRNLGLAAAVVALLGLWQCGPATSAARPGPLALVGMWQVSSQGERNAFLALGDELVVWSRCGVLVAPWLADSSGDFVGGNHGLGCAAGPDWLVQSTAYRQDGDDYLLLGPDGRTRARLVRGGAPPSRPDIADSFREPPTVTARVRVSLAPSAPLPPELTPATRRQLIGRWVPELSRPGPDAHGPAVTLTAKGGWSGSDGCNFSSGRWVLGTSGALLAPLGPVTDMACWITGSPAPGSVGPFVGGASRAGFDGKVLVLLDRSSHELGRLRRA
jgi:hypothetical protein